jgi:hypothetical protein
MQGSRSMTLLYNDGCGTCRSIAAKVESYSKGRIGLLPLGTSKTEEVLAKFYPGGHHPFDFFLLEEKDGETRCRRGTSAALRLARVLPITKSLNLFGSYVRRKAYVSYVATKIVRSERPEPGAMHSTARRNFLRTMLFGAAGLAVTSMTLGAMSGVASASTMRLNSRGATAQKSTRLTNLRLSDPSVAPVSSVVNPDCIPECCICPDICCVDCVGGYWICKCSEADGCSTYQYVCGQC